MSPQTPADGRRDPSRQRLVRKDRRSPKGQYWTVPEIAADLRMTERSIWRKFLDPGLGPRHSRHNPERQLAYYYFEGEARIDQRDYLAFKQRCRMEVGPQDGPQPAVSP